jgi:hypothetical protein
VSCGHSWLGGVLGLDWAVAWWVWSSGLQNLDGTVMNCVHLTSSCSRLGRLLGSNGAAALWFTQMMEAGLGNCLSDNMGASLSKFSFNNFLDEWLQVLNGRFKSQLLDLPK